MRGARWLLLVAIAAILGGIGVTYRTQRRALREQSPPKPQALPSDLNSTAEHYVYCQSDKGRTVSCVEAREFRQSKDSSRVDLKDVILKVYNKDASGFDLIKSAAATFFKDDNRFTADGEVDITLGVPAVGEPPHTLVSIHTSGVNLDTYRARPIRTSWPLSCFRTATANPTAPPTNLRRDS